MTIVIGLKCADGVVIATDTQSQFGRGVDVKRLDANKIYKIDDDFVVAGAGTVAHIEKGASAIKLGLATAKNKTGEKLLSKEVCITTIEQTMTAIHKEYNIDRSRYLDDPREREFFDPILVVGGSINNDNNDKINCLFIAHPDGMVENVVDYASIGSGAAYAEFLLKDLHYDSMSTKEAISIAIHTINEVKSIDPNCGGDTRVACVNNTSVEELGNAQITELSKKKYPQCLI